jgi:hypothetical protein
MSYTIARDLCPSQKSEVFDSQNIVQVECKDFEFRRVTRGFVGWWQLAQHGLEFEDRRLRIAELRNARIAGLYMWKMRGPQDYICEKCEDREDRRLRIARIAVLLYVRNARVARIAGQWTWGLRGLRGSQANEREDRRVRNARIAGQWKGESHARNVRIAGLQKWGLQVEDREDWGPLNTKKMRESQERR